MNLSGAIKSDDGWWDLSPVWDTLYSIGKKRHAQKDEFKSTRAWNKQSHIIGIMGEFVVSSESGIPFDTELRLLGDGGKDFKFGTVKVDIKCSTYLNDPDLKHPKNSKEWANYFVLVALDERNRKAKLIGWATGESLKISEEKDYGYGPQKIVNWRKLEKGLPPCFKNDIQIPVPVA